MGSQCRRALVLAINSNLRPLLLVPTSNSTFALNIEFWLRWTEPEFNIRVILEQGLMQYSNFELSNIWMLNSAIFEFNECWMLNFECWILNIEYWILNIEFWILNIECWIPNVEYCTNFKAARNCSAPILRKPKCECHYIWKQIVEAGCHWHAPDWLENSRCNFWG